MVKKLCKHNLTVGTCTDCLPRRQTPRVQRRRKPGTRPYLGSIARPYSGGLPS